MEEALHAALSRAGKTDLQRLAHAFAAVNATLSLEDTLQRVTHAARAIIGTHQALTSFTVGQHWDQAVTAVSHSDPAHVAGDRLPPEAVRRLVCDGNEPVRMTREELETHPDRGDLVEPDAPPRAWVAAPLVGRDGDNIGLVQVTDKLEGEFTADDEAILAQLAQFASVAVENARVYERERGTARTLQRRLMPEALPPVNGLEITARYLPGGEGVEVGGDWYDVIPLGTDRVGLVIGDVMGRGVEAASVMGQLRIGLRAYALDHATPGAALQSLARLVHSLGGEYFVTVLYAVWDLAADSLAFASAGHLAPLLRRADGTLAYLKGEQGLPIGVDPNAEYVEHRVDAPAGSTLLLFTDGLVERRDTRIGDMLDALAREVARAGADIDETAEQLLRVGPPLDSSDDTALLIARRPGTARGRAAVASTLQLAVLPLPGEARAVGHARRWLVQRLHRWSAAQAVDVVELLASEIVTNAVVHATTDLLVRLEHLGDRVRVAVTDGRSTVPSRRDFATDAPGGRGMGLVDALADAWGVEVVERGKVVWFEVLLR